MGKIVSFRPREPARKPRPVTDTAPAKVIIFTGVRYERAPPADSASKWTPAGWMAPFQPQPLPRS